MFEYKTISIGWPAFDKISELLNVYTKDGWRVHTFIGFAPHRFLLERKLRPISTGVDEYGDENFVYPNQKEYADYLAGMAKR